ncbi:SCP2 sterol-binding domain-containing protein [Paenibacillus sp. J22TS3]|uniref:SCP2 sterol-binding domain-containing protein n=1 Tax=Paenibacillus sp. J22TS3 TaxID=2807192 RepID=UPI001B1296EF|nr:SCP2 sterol-binding domain-containing protein [Paenibacillus sp. J22TS3]GIP20719.1 hypothetical protein J22TS3_09940 [Paenibacillus sp. J22TS3]
MGIKEEFMELASEMNERPEPLASLDSVYQFNLKKGGTYQVHFKNGVVRVLEESDSAADCTLILSEGNLHKLLNNELNTTVAFMTGSLKVEGKLGLALKLQEILKHYRG